MRDLIPFVGRLDIVAEILAGKRPLNMAMIRALCDGLDIPYESLAGGCLSRSDTAG